MKTNPALLPEGFTDSGESPTENRQLRNSVILSMASGAGPKGGQMTDTPCQHDYRPLGGGYYKRDGDKMTDIGLPKMDQSKSYRMLYCSKCGETKEVLAADHMKIPA
jgi:hypothetical protein